MLQLLAVGELKERCLPLSHGSDEVAIVLLIGFVVVVNPVGDRLSASRVVASDFPGRRKGLVELVAKETASSVLSVLLLLGV